MPAIGLGFKFSRPDIVSRKRAEDVARDADISRPHLSRIENGHILPIPEVGERLKRIVDWRPAVREYLARVLAEASETDCAPSTEVDRAEDAPASAHEDHPDAVYPQRRQREARLRIRR